MQLANTFFFIYYTIIIKVLFGLHHSLPTEQNFNGIWNGLADVAFQMNYMTILIYMVSCFLFFLVHRVR